MTKYHCKIHSFQLDCEARETAVSILEVSHNYNSYVDATLEEMTPQEITK